MYYSPNRGNIGNISLNVANYYINPLEELI